MEETFLPAVGLAARLVISVSRGSGDDRLWENNQYDTRSQTYLPAA